MTHTAAPSPERPHVLVLRHVDCEHPGTYSSALEDVAEMRTVRAGTDPIPADPGDAAALVVMGGPMGVGDAEALPWLREEIALVARALDRGLPVWGVCLGAQILAAATGADCHPGAAPEVGVSTLVEALGPRGVPLSVRDPVWHGLLDGLPALHWHGDTFDVPADTTLLAGTESYPNQLVRMGVSYGLQFHLEVTPDMVDEWLRIPEYAHALRTVHGEDGAAWVRRQVAEAAGAMRAAADTAMRRWVATWAPREGRL